MNSVMKSPRCTLVDAGERPSAVAAQVSCVCNPLEASKEGVLVAVNIAGCKKIPVIGRVKAVPGKRRLWVRVHERDLEDWVENMGLTQWDHLSWFSTKGLCSFSTRFYIKRAEDVQQCDLQILAGETIRTEHKKKSFSFECRGQLIDSFGFRLVMNRSPTCKIISANQIQNLNRKESHSHIYSFYAFWWLVNYSDLCLIKGAPSISLRTSSYLYLVSQHSIMIENGSI